MTPCSDFADRLARAADLSAAEAIDPALAAHLQTCESCRAALDDQRRIRVMLTSRPALAASPALRVRVREALEQERTWTGVIDFRRWTWRLVPVAAAVALLTVFGVQATTGGSTSTDVSELGDLPVSAVLYAGDVSDSSALTLMLRAHADERLASYLEPAVR
jgi:predicted anti-sigma-YlaC factor YlaD